MWALSPDRASSATDQMQNNVFAVGGCFSFLGAGMVKTRKRLGDLLLEAGLITPEQLEKALNVQKKDGGTAGESSDQPRVYN